MTTLEWGDDPDATATQVAAHAADHGTSKANDVYTNLMTCNCPSTVMESDYAEVRGKVLAQLKDFKNAGDATVEDALKARSPLPSDRGAQVSVDNPPQAAPQAVQPALFTSPGSWEVLSAAPQTLAQQYPDPTDQDLSRVMSSHPLDSVRPDTAASCFEVWNRTQRLNRHLFDDWSADEVRKVLECTDAKSLFCLIGQIAKANTIAVESGRMWLVLSVFRTTGDTCQLLNALHFRCIERPNTPLNAILR